MEKLFSFFIQFNLISCHLFTHHFSRVSLIFLFFSFQFYYIFNITTQKKGIFYHQFIHSLRFLTVAVAFLNFFFSLEGRLFIMRINMELTPDDDGPWHLKKLDENQLIVFTLLTQVRSEIWRFCLFFVIKVVFFLLQPNLSLGVFHKSSRKYSIFSFFLVPTHS
jgi:hypothetical protein